MLHTEVLKYDRVLFTSSLNHSWNHSFGRGEKAAARRGNAKLCLNPSQKHLLLGSWHLILHSFSATVKSYTVCQWRGNERWYHSVMESSSKQLHLQPENSHEVFPYRIRPRTPFFSNLGLMCTEEVNHRKKSLRNNSSELVPSSSVDGPKPLSALFEKTSETPWFLHIHTHTHPLNVQK